MLFAQPAMCVCVCVLLCVCVCVASRCAFPMSCARKQGALSREISSLASPLLRQRDAVVDFLNVRGPLQHAYSWFMYLSVATALSTFVFQFHYFQRFGNHEQCLTPTCCGASLLLQWMGFYRIGQVIIIVFLVRASCACWHRRVPKFWTHRTKLYCFCDRSVREKAWRSRKRVAQAT
jgi:hypothetical protein